MESDSQAIIDKYETTVANGVYSAGKVDTIVADLKAIQKASLRKRKLLLSDCLVFASVSAIDRGMMRRKQIKITQLPSADSDHPSVCKLQSDDPFDIWVDCDGIATVPEAYVNFMS